MNQPRTLISVLRRRRILRPRLRGCGSYVPGGVMWRRAKDVAVFGVGRGGCAT
jgi:hypothetical protein